jgi:hypothetical protein
MSGCNVKHKDLTSNNIHVVVAGSFANEAARYAGTYLSIDVDKVYKDTDTNCYWLLVDHTNSGNSAGWEEITNKAAGGTQVKVSSNDTTAGFLSDKLVAGSTKVSVTEVNDGSDEDLSLDINEANINHDNLAGYVATEHIDWTQPGAGTIDPSNYSGGGSGSSDRYLQFGDSSGTAITETLLQGAGGSRLGFKMMDSGFIKGIGAISDCNCDCEYEILKNDIEVANLQFSNESEKSRDDLNIAYSVGDKLNVRFRNSSNVNEAYTPDANTLFLASMENEDVAERTVTNSSTIQKGNNGRLQNGTIPTTSGIDLDGINDWVEILHQKEYEVGDCTVEMFINPDDVSGDEHFFSKDSSGYDTGGHISIKKSGSSIVVRSQTTSASKEITASSVLTAGIESHVAVVLGTGGIKLFVDGVLGASDATWTQGLTGNREPIIAGASAQYSGNGVPSSLNEYLAGKLRDLRISNSRRYEAGFTAPTSLSNDANTLGLWKMNESVGSIAIDLSDTINHCMVQATGSYPTFSTTSKHGTHSVKMNNSSNDWLKMIHHADYEKSQITVEGWIHQYTDTADGMIFQKGDSSTEGGLQVKWLKTNERLEVTYWGATTNKVITTANNSFSSYEWKHFAVVLTTSELKIYIDDALVHTEALSGDYANVWANNKEDIFWAKKEDDTLFHQAYFDELRISDVERIFGHTNVMETQVLVRVED